MIPGEVIPLAGEITLNEDRKSTTLSVANTGDRPIQIGSHYHFGEANSALEFDREIALGMRLDIAAGTAIRFEPGQQREVELIEISGSRRIFGFNQKVMGEI
tara:strand:+ start:172 stop:477 length:306 start_codon:yes stop_codon:yes gene_type:complete